MAEGLGMLGWIWLLAGCACLIVAGHAIDVWLRRRALARVPSRPPDVDDPPSFHVTWDDDLSPEEIGVDELVPLHVLEPRWWPSPLHRHAAKHEQPFSLS